jgi:hypothetical protein
MTDYSSISDVEVAPGQPAFASVMRRQRDNLKALAEGSSTVPVNERLTPGSFKPMETGTVEMFRQRPGAVIDSTGGVTNVFVCVIFIPGVYRLAATTSNNDTYRIRKNGSIEHEIINQSTFDVTVTCSNGDRLTVDMINVGGTVVSIEDLRLMGSYAAPLAQCEFRYS